MAEPSTCPPNLPPIRTPLASAQPASATPTALSASSESLESSAPPATPSPPMTQAPSPPPLPSSTAGAQPPPPPCSTKPTQTAAPPPPPTPLPQLPSAATSGVAAQALSSGLVSAASSSLDPGYLDAQKGLGLRNSPHGSELCSPFRLAASTFDGSNRKKEEGKQRIGRRVRACLRAREGCVHLCVSLTALMVLYKKKKERLWLRHATGCCDRLLAHGLSTISCVFSKPPSAHATPFHGPPSLTQCLDTPEITAHVAANPQKRTHTGWCPQYLCNALFAARQGVGFAPQASDGSGTSGDSPGASPSPSSGPLSPRSIPLGHSCHRASALKGRSSADHGVSELAAIEGA
eukprot:scaffold119593_cov16-Tisochrysis_lutea.AAC.1